MASAIPPKRLRLLIVSRFNFFITVMLNTSTGGTVYKLTTPVN